MTREDATRYIQSTLPTLDDDQIVGLADQVRAMGRDVVNPWSPDQLALIEQAREDFKLGRTLSSEEMWAGLDAYLEGAAPGYGAVP